MWDIYFPPQSFFLLKSKLAGLIHLIVTNLFWLWAACSRGWRHWKPDDLWGPFQSRPFYHSMMWKLGRILSYVFTEQHTYSSALTITCIILFSFKGNSLSLKHHRSQSYFSNQSEFVSQKFPQSSNVAVLHHASDSLLNFPFSVGSFLRFFYLLFLRIFETSFPTLIFFSLFFYIHQRTACLQSLGKLFFSQF